MPVSSHIRAVSLAALCALLLLAPLDTTRAEIVHGDATLWAVHGAAEGSTSYVFGTIHSDDERVLELDSRVERAFEDAERYAFELDFRKNIQAKMSQAMFDREPPTLRDQLSADTWESARSAASERGLPGQAVALMKPWALAITLAMPPINPQKSLDKVLFDRAVGADGPVEGLETADEQLSLFADLPQSDQLAMLRRVLEMHGQDKIAPLFEDLTQRWLEGDLAGLMALSESHPMLPDGERNEAFEERVIQQRNERMAERARPLIEQGGAFIAVGALHLPGERGLLRLLEQAGYTVEPVE